MGISAAEEALEQLKNRLTSLERELQDAKFKVTNIHIISIILLDRQPQNTGCIKLATSQ